MVQVKKSDNLMCGFEGTVKINLSIEFVSRDIWVAAFLIC